MKALRLLLVAGSLLASACADPVHDAAVAALGPEAPGVSPGPEHRPGQPCLVCHDGSGPGSITMRFGGTAYISPTRTPPLVGGLVHFRDENGVTFETETNCVGNFYVEAGQYDPTFPVRPTVSFGDVSIEMISHIGRDGSCASCHHGEDQSSTDQVYLSAGPISVPSNGCPQ